MNEQTNITVNVANILNIFENKEGKTVIVQTNAVIDPWTVVILKTKKNNSVSVPLKCNAELIFEDKYCMITIFNTHLLQILQWCALSGLGRMHFRHRGPPVAMLLPLLSVTT